MLDPKTGTVYVDNTTLRSVATCDTQSAIRHVLGYSGTGEDAYALECGIAAHEVFASYLAGKSAEYCLSQYELLYRGYSEDAGLDNPQHPFYRLSWTNTDVILKEWFETHPLENFPFKVNPKLIEVGFATPLSDECVCTHLEVAHDGHCLQIGCDCSEFHHAFVMWGRLDAIVESPNRKLFVLDHKTTGRLAPYWSEKFRTDSQMTGYVWAAQKTLGMPVEGVYINGVEFSKLPSHPTRKCTIHGVPYQECGPLHVKSELLVYTRTPDQLEQWRQDAIRLARKHRAQLCQIQGPNDLTNVPLTGTFTNACGFCDFKNFCQAGRPVHYLDQMLVHHPWQPYELPG